MIKTELDLLAFELEQAKSKKEELEETILDIEGKIVAVTGVKTEGSEMTESCFYKITTNGKIYRRLDNMIYQEIKNHIPESLNPVVLKPSIDLKKLRSLEKNAPLVYETFCKALTITPGKPGVIIKRKDGYQ